jgi:hypothetical protein
LPQPFGNSDLAFTRYRRRFHGDLRNVIPGNTSRFRDHFFRDYSCGRAALEELLGDIPGIPGYLDPLSATVFLPVGWWHFVESLDFSISVSFTNFLWNNDFTETYPPRTGF